MAFRVHALEKKIFVSVRDLARIPEFHRLGSRWSRAWGTVGQGNELHADILAHRTKTIPGYRAEVHLSTSVQVGEWTVEITGRLDGACERLPGSWLIEEFKSVRGGFQSINPPVWHQRQLQYYCDIWRLLNPGQPVEGSLVYVDFFTRRQVHVVLQTAGETGEQGLLARLKFFCTEVETEISARGLKALFARGMEFPHKSPRPAQIPLVERIEKCLPQGQLLFIEAPTGVGKTAATIYSALQQSLMIGKRLAFLTSKTMQQNLAVEVAQTLNEHGGFRSIQIRSKEKMCANGQVLCHEDFCPYARDYPEKMEKSNLLGRMMSRRRHHSPDSVFEAACGETVCPFEVQLELAKTADLMIADYNYVFEPGTALFSLSDEELERSVLLIDEAHNLPDRVREIYSPEIAEVDFAGISRFLAGYSEKTCQEMSELLWTSIGTFFRSCSKIGTGQSQMTEAPVFSFRDFYADWLPLFGQYLQWKAEQPAGFAAEDKVPFFHANLTRFMAVLQLFDHRFRCLLEMRESGLILKIVCLDSGPFVGRILAQSFSAVLMSGTLSPRRFYERLFGVGGDRVEWLKVASGFPVGNRKIMVFPEVGTQFQVRKKHRAKTCEIIGQICRAVPGSLLVLFPSYTFLNEVANDLPPTDLPVILQKPRLQERERSEIFTKLENNRKCMVFAVLGGMLAEGLDYPGNLLKGIVIISPGLPQISIERELLRGYFDRELEEGFNYAYVIPGMTKVIQAAGRLIRSEKDFGIITLICQRFSEDTFSSLFPRDWYQSSPLELVTPDPMREIQQFFADQQMAQASLPPSTG